jgi:hypothetical protein
MFKKTIQEKIAQILKANGITSEDLDPFDIFDLDDLATKLSNRIEQICAHQSKENL